MSNRPKRPSGAARPQTPGTGDRGRLLVVLGVLAVVVFVGVIVALGAAEEDQKDYPDFGPVLAEGESLAQLPDGGEDPAVASPAPRVEGLDPENGIVRLGGSQDQPTVAFFLAHWCEFCQREVPEVVELMDEGELDGIRVVAVLTGTRRGAPNHPPVGWLEDEGWSGEIMLDDEQATAAAAYGLSSYPFAVYLDEEGNVVSRTSGGRGKAAILQSIEALRADVG